MAGALIWFQINEREREREQGREVRTRVRVNDMVAARFTVTVQHMVTAKVIVTA